MKYGMIYLVHQNIQNQNYKIKYMENRESFYTLEIYQNVAY